MNDLLFGKADPKYYSTEAVYSSIASFEDNPAYENGFLSNSDTAESVFLLGSSELTVATEARPFLFISSHFKTKVTGVGHAGNQSLSIYMQLLANRMRLKDAPIVIIVSPGWFEYVSAEGTSSQVFLEFNSNRFLKKVLDSGQHDEFYNYACSRVSDLYDEFNAPSLELKLMHFRHLASGNSISKLIYTPLISLDQWLLDQKCYLDFCPSQSSPVKRGQIQSEDVHINWDSLYSAIVQEARRKSTNNDMGIENEYYATYCNGYRGRIRAVKQENNQELKDFIMLVRLLRHYNARASFIIQPMNPMYYDKIETLQPTIISIEKEIKSNRFPCLNLFTSSPAQFEKGILTDVMHLGDLGWYKINRFIIETYNLSNENDH